MSKDERGEAAIRTLEKLGGCQQRHKGHINVFCAECHGHEVSSLQATIRELVEAAEDLMQWCRMNEGDGHGEVPTKLCMAMTKAIHEAKKATNEGRG